MGSLLSQLLPGVRIIRTPITVALLWILTGLLYKATASHRVQVVIDHVIHNLELAIKPVPGPVAAGAIGSLMYIGGVLLSNLGEIASTFLKFALIFILIVVALLAPVSFLSFLNQWILGRAVLLIAILTVIGVVARRRLRSRRAEEGRFGDGNFTRNLDLIRLLNRSRPQSLILFQSMFSDEIAAIDWLAKDFLVNQAASRPKFRKKLICSIPDHGLSKVLFDLSGVLDLSRLQKIGRSHHEARVRSYFTTGGLPVGVSLDLQNLERGIENRESGVLKVIRGFLIDEFAKPYQARRCVAMIFDYSAVFNDARHALSEMRVVLQKSHETIFSEYDRLISEAEFRTAIALPVSLVCFFLGKLVSAELLLSRAGSGGAEVWTLLACVAIFIYWVLRGSSLKHRNWAYDLLWAAYRQGLLVEVVVPKIVARDIRPRRGVLSAQPIYSGSKFGKVMNRMNALIKGEGSYMVQRAYMRGVGLAHRVARFDKR